MASMILVLLCGLLELTHNCMAYDDEVVPAAESTSEESPEQTGEVAAE